jgi:hypothetical protein
VVDAVRAAHAELFSIAHTRTRRARRIRFTSSNIKAIDMRKSIENPVLVNTYGTKKVDLATFGKGGRSVEQIDEATAAQRADSNAASPRRYGER